MSKSTSGRDPSWESITTAISAEPPPVIASSHQQPCLVVLAGGRFGELVTIDDTVTIGRSVDAEFCIPDDGVSRIHLRIERVADGSVRVVDADSRNGTFVNGKRVEEATLHDGDKIYIGTRAILRFSYTDHLEEAFQQQMYEAALRDSLTGLFNRRHLLAQLEVELHFVRRHGSPLTVVLVDIDHFKQVNDQHGHLVGDALLRRFGEHLRMGVRGADFAARYGGEEFVIVSRGIRPPSGAQLAERLQRELLAVELVSELPELTVTFSAGVAGIPDPRIGEDVERLLQAADKAMYAAKHGGRNKVCSFDGF